MLGCGRSGKEKPWTTAKRLWPGGDQPARLPQAGGGGARGSGPARRGWLRGWGDQAGGTTITLAFTPDEAGGLEKLIRRFNEQNRGAAQVKWREMPALSADYFEQIQAELQSGKSSVDVIGGDVIWPAQFASNGYILDLTDRFTSGMQEEYLEGPLESVQYQGRPGACRGSPTLACSTIAWTCWRRAGPRGLPGPGK